MGSNQVLFTKSARVPISAGNEEATWMTCYLRSPRSFPTETGYDRNWSLLGLVLSLRARHSRQELPVALHWFRVFLLWKCLVTHKANCLLLDPDCSVLGIWGLWYQGRETQERSSKSKLSCLKAPSILLAFQFSLPLGDLCSLPICTKFNPINKVTKALLITHPLECRYSSMVIEHWSLTFSPVFTVASW